MKRYAVLPRRRKTPQGHNKSAGTEYKSADFDGGSRKVQPAAMKAAWVVQHAATKAEPEMQARKAEDARGEAPLKEPVSAQAKLPQRCSKATS